MNPKRPEARRFLFLFLLTLLSGLSVFALFASPDDATHETTVDGDIRPWLFESPIQSSQPLLPSSLPSCPLIRSRGDIVPSPVYENDHTIFFGPVWGYAPRIWRSRDDGASWRVIYQAPFKDGQVNALAAVHSPGAAGLTLYVRYWHYRQEIYGLARSTDGGDTWDERTTCDWYCEGIYTTNQPEAIFVVRVEPYYPSHSGMGILRSDDGGLSWQEVWNESNAFVLFISPAFAEDALLYAVVDDGMIRSSDGGMSWQRPTDEPRPGAPLVYSPDFARDRTVFGGRGHILYKSEDGGLSWRAVLTLSGDEGITDLEISPDFGEDGALFIGTPHSLLVSHDEGANWSVVFSSQDELIDLDVRRRAGHAASASDQNDSGARSRPLSLFVAMNKLGTRYYYAHSSDGGLTWQCLNPPPEQ